MLRVVVLASLVLLTALAHFQLPEYMKLCSRDDPNLNECIRSNLQELFPRFCKGEPIFDLPPLDPFEFYLGMVEVKQGNLYGNTNIKNSTAIGNRDIRFNKVRANLSDPRKLELELDFFHPNLFIEGEYDSAGKVIVFNVNGSGQYNVTMKNLISRWQLRGELVNGDDGEEYMRINWFGVTSNIGSLKLYASDLFGGNKQITKAILRFVNRSWRMLYNRIAPMINESFNRSMLHIANTVFLKVPYNQLFPLSNKTDQETNLTTNATETKTDAVKAEATDSTEETATSTDTLAEAIAETDAAKETVTVAEATDSTEETATSTDTLAEAIAETETDAAKETVKLAETTDSTEETATSADTLAEAIAETETPTEISYSPIGTDEAKGTATNSEM